MSACLSVWLSKCLTVWLSDCPSVRSLDRTVRVSAVLIELSEIPGGGARWGTRVRTTPITPLPGYHYPPYWPSPWCRTACHRWSDGPCLVHQAPFGYNDTARYMLILSEPLKSPKITKITEFPCFISHSQQPNSLKMVKTALFHGFSWKSSKITTFLDPFSGFCHKVVLLLFGPRSLIKNGKMVTFWTPKNTKNTKNSWKSVF